MSETGAGTHRQILRSSALIGGSSVVNVLLGLVRAKFTAVYLGTVGVGLLGTYASIAALVGALAGLGIGTSGVRQIAEAAATGDQLRIARTILTIRRAALVLGSAGMLLMAAAARPLSRWTFGDADHSTAIALLSVTILLGAVSGGQAALVQGARRIGDLARLNVLGALLGTLVAIPLMIAWGEASVVPILIVGSATTIVTSWYYARKIEVAQVVMSWRDTRRDAAPLLALGLAFASSALLSTGVAYLTRVILIRRLDLDAVGLYGAAWNLSSFYVGFILGAMGADFYPRLTAVAHDDVHVNRLVNEQTEVSLILTLPGAAATLTCAPWVLHLLYSPAFVPAGDLLRWQVLGLVLRVLSWPMGFIILAKGNARLFFCSELASHLVHLGLIWMGVRLWGLSGAGVAFLGLYFFYTVLMVFVSRRLTGFRWSAANRRLIPLTAAVSLGAFMAAAWLPLVWAMVVGSTLAAVTGAYSMATLTRLTGGNPIVAAIHKVRRVFGGNRSEPG